MILIRGEEAVPDHCRGAAVAIGNFDGVHRGHQALLAAARERAHEAGGPFGLLTFEPHPRSYFRPEEPVFRLSPLPLKARLAEALGAHLLAALSFDKHLANLEAEDFVRNVLAERFGVRQVVTGFDFHFGHGRKGNVDLLRRLGSECGFGVTTVEQVTDEDGNSPFASSSIRASLRHGHVETAARQLGYWWTVLGRVEEGDRRGRQLGLPTANIVLEEGVEPREGIYAVRIHLEAEPARRPLHGAAYVGTRPTFATGRKFLEVHILEFEGDLYGHWLMVDFIAYLRPDRAFDGIGALVEQMKADCREASRRLELLEVHDPLTGFTLGELQAKGML
jgi:riboflavin kinase/FMN adenylyltransferase